MNNGKTYNVENKAGIVPAKRRGFVHLFRVGRAQAVAAPGNHKALTEGAVRGLTILDMPGNDFENMCMNWAAWKRCQLDLGYIKSNGGQLREDGTQRTRKSATVKEGARHD